MKLDLKDRKISYELDLNSRQSYKEIAKKVGLSKDSVQYRINNLMKEGIIKSFSTVIDAGKLGYISFRLLLKFYSTTPEKEEEIINFLLSNKNLLWLVRIEGSWDANTWFLYKSLDEMNDFWKKLLEKYGNYIDKRELGIYSNIFYFNRAYLLNKKERNPPINCVSFAKQRDFDKHELEIVKLLSENARMQITDIAKRTKLTPKTVINKIKKLESEKVILGYRTEFDLDKLGYKYYKIHINTFRTNKEKIQEFKEYLQENPNVVYDNEVLGGYDLEIEVQLENEDKLRELINDLRDKFSDIIRDYEVLHYYKEYRLRFFP